MRQEVLQRARHGSAPGQHHVVEGERLLQGSQPPQLAQHSGGVGAGPAVHLDAQPDVAIRQVLDVLDSLQTARGDDLLDPADDLLRPHQPRQLQDADGLATLAHVDDGGPRSDPDRPPPAGVDVGQPVVENHPAGGKVRRRKHGQQVLDRHVRVGHLQPHRLVHLTQVVRRHVGGHPHGDPARAVHQQVRQPPRQADRLGGLAVVAGAEVHGVLVQLVEHLHGRRRQPALGVPGRRRRVVERAEVALGVHKRDGAAEVLPHAHQRVVDGGVAVRVVLPHGVAHDAGALAMWRLGPQPHAQHRVQDATLHRFEPVAHVGDGPGRDHRQRVRQERLRHLVGDRRVADLAGERQTGGRSGTASWAHRSTLTAGLSLSRARAWWRISCLIAAGPAPRWQRRGSPVRAYRLWVSAPRGTGRRPS